MAPRRVRAWGFVLAFLALDAALLGWWWRSRPVMPPTVAGVVVDPDGRPVEAVLSWPLGRWDYLRLPTDDQGRFEVLLPDHREVLVAYGSGYSESAPLSIDGDAGTSVEDVVLRLRRPARIAGRLVDEAGIPMAGVVVSCGTGTSVNGCSMGIWATTDSDGRFVFEALTPGPAGLYTCRTSRHVELAESETNEVLVSLTAEEAHDAREYESEYVPGRPMSGPK